MSKNNEFELINPTLLLLLFLLHLRYGIFIKVIAKCRK